METYQPTGLASYYAGTIDKPKGKSNVINSKSKKKKCKKKSKK